ncbi:MAG TPA: bifunctional DNA-formamidopyrimidine glycosylase/DNA-(apurinic or apyrimidinic site) lyase [Myxococcaceae bacterium]|jgi:formamidopyrimidine-DNA glycosylase|nr:bifunctional DNA-formamidopyrimidine glycosylase/DNA-(apurinic or apyrimidinic site) lyase [Myxococcaceae bacterium]
MPELPEVEIARRNLARWLGRAAVARAEADRTRIFRGADRSAFTRLRGRLTFARRRGKVLLLGFEGNRGFLSHLGMTGKWVRRRSGQPEPYSRARLVLDDGSVLHYRDPRLFGRIEPAPAGALERLPAVRALGPDPLLDAVDGPTLEAALGTSRVPVKVALLDQRRLAGLGNIHAAEALWRAKVSPVRPARSLRPEEWRRLARAISAGIRFALGREDSEEVPYVEEPGTPNPFRVYGRAGKPCPRCRTVVRSVRQAGRSTYFCPRCQPARRKR